MSATVYNSITLCIASIGVTANTLLVLVILTRTPSYMRTYAYLLISSAFGDLIGLLSVMATLPREVIHEQLLVIQFHGICATVAEEACWMVFGLLQWMFSATCALLTASFALRLAILSMHNIHKPVVSTSIIFIVSAFIPVAFMFANIFRIGSPYASTESVSTLFVTNTTQLGIIDQTDGFTAFTLNFTILTALILFISCIVLRFMILRKLNAIQHKLSAQARQGHVMLIRALNIQLPLTGFYFCATFIYVLNSTGILTGDAVDYWTTPIANLQNVLTPMVNLWIIQPYKRSILDFCGCRRSTGTSTRVESSAYSNMTTVA